MPCLRNKRIGGLVNSLSKGEDQTRANCRLVWSSFKDAIWIKVLEGGIRKDAELIAEYELEFESETKKKEKKNAMISD